MAKQSIEQQVAALTEEQKNNLESIYKKYHRCLIFILIGALVLTLGLYCFFSVREAEAKDRYDAATASLLMSDSYNSPSYKTSYELLDEYFDAKELTSLAFVIGPAALLVAELIVILLFKQKYPYFSEKKYRYVKKQINP